jgi:hypothetical protein
LAEQAEMSENLRGALASRAVIDQALGIVMGQNRCTADEAFDTLRTISQNRNVKLSDVAAQVITAVSGQPPASELRLSWDPRSRPPAHPPLTRHHHITTRSVHEPVHEPLPPRAFDAHSGASTTHCHLGEKSTSRRGGANYGSEVCLGFGSSRPWGYRAVGNDLASSCLGDLLAAVNVVGSAGQGGVGHQM